MIEIDITKKLFSAQGEFTLALQLSIEQGEFISLFGQSGAGKTTLLRCLAGLEKPDGGTIKVNGETWFDSRVATMLPARHRRAGYMFQDYALFPNMTVRGNLEFALRPEGDRKRVAELIEMMGLGELQQRKPDTLSGGQKQRVALARALAAEPKLLLLDEPFSALDHTTRVRLQDEVMRMQRHYGLTTVMVSHDISEVYKLSQRVLVIEHGRIAKQGTPAEVFKAGQANGKFSFAGEVLDIETADVVFAVTLLVGNQVVRVIATADEVKSIKQGDRVMLMSKAFNPVLVAVGSL
ncbi:MAG: molybdenum ABC transporter ATP-binding protein [Gallionellales bacterium 35-53-114]|jgi:molybdate transport system ATP-binding protein|nr:MAG: molybdenum ABC transporter ATP-binding protein [Gallionellales bacterium 35-53-114]OYZ65196.1 MAG: molybdenum ABC transporter ATP-binding protein [Gallionellales bacterium 24-53-125]OZB08102.1 MAG: molybdenum ABC transporter ATP-binding protein [Gallionellales bacterium 39-52-133]HQS58022.1 ATP-binding cassette domain-containing protein [Gallionellaceae bacterium]HQS73578.1 ATP-binding cassette domain-containing protein [Gallionellaceae bacterium]